MWRTHAVRHREFARRDRLEKLVVLVNDLHGDAIAVGRGHPRQPESERDGSIRLDRAEIADRQQISHTAIRAPSHECFETRWYSCNSSTTAARCRWAQSRDT